MSKRTRVIGAVSAALLAAPLAVVVLAGPAAAGDEHPLEAICGMSPHEGDADGTIATDSELEGAGIYNVTAEDQDLDESLDPGEAVRFFVEYLNDDDVTHDIVVRGDMNGEAPPPGYVIKAKRISNGKDVTDKVFGLSGLRLRNVLAGDEAAELVFRVKRKTTASGFVAGFVSGNYEVASACGDTVGFGAGSISG